LSARHAAEQVKVEKALAELSALEALAEERARPWWRRLRG
jgi:hypothetical protein